MSSANYCILVADDIPEVVESVAAYLEQLAHRFKDRIQILRAGSATDVLACLSEHPIDVLFLDYKFEHGISGDEIIDRIDDPFGQKLIILMSGQSQQSLEGIIIKRHKHLRERFKFLRKPFDFLEMEDKYLEIEKFYSSRPYPFPLAYAFAVFSSSPTAQGKLTAIKDLIESITKYSVAVLMADLHRLNLVDQVSLNLKWNLELTLGAWLSWLDTLLDCFSSKTNVAYMPELIHLLKSERKQGQSHFEWMRRFKDIRDDELAHGFVREEEGYTELVDRFAGSAQSLYRDLAFMSRYSLFVPETINFGDKAPDEYEYKVRLLMGAETRFGLTTLRSRARLPKGELYLHSPTGQFLSLHPLVTFAICPICSLSRIYFPDGIFSTHVVYNAYCNHRRNDEKSKAVFDAKFGGTQPRERN